MLTGACVKPVSGGGSSRGRRSSSGTAGSTLLLTEYLAFVLDHRNHQDLRLATEAFGAWKGLAVGLQPRARLFTNRPVSYRAMNKRPNPRSHESIFWVGFRQNRGKRRSGVSERETPLCTLGQGESNSGEISDGLFLLGNGFFAESIS